ncbi:MAG: BrnT family toxin [Gammaproteobacteria bacterium]
MEFVWDPRKAATNLRKHKVSFEEAATALKDTLSITGVDPDHSIGEFRWLTFGVSDQGRLLAVAHTEEDDVIRIISARTATNVERVLYEEG